MSFDIRTLEQSDIAEAALVIQAAFRRDVDFRPTLWLHRRIEPEGFWVAVERDRIVGTVGCLDYGQFAYVALMTVHPDAQGRGIGRRLMEHGLRWLDERGCPVALLDATDQGSLLYRTLDFVEDSSVYDFERDRVVSIPSRAAGVRIAVEKDFDAIAVFDQPVFGADRRRLLRVLWEKERERCFVVADPAGDLRGYLFARDAVLGPWAAATPQVAEDLLIAALSLDDAGSHVLVPRSNRFAIELLTRYGFVECRCLSHMRRGGDAPPGQPQRLFGQSSLAHG